MADGARDGGMATNLLLDNMLVKPMAGESVSHLVMPTTVAQRLQEILDETGWSARALSTAVGAGHATLGAVLSGRSQRPAAELLRAVAERTGYRVEWLISGSGEPKGSPTISSDRIHPVIAAVAAAARYTDHEAELASTSIRGLAGTSSMTEEQALEFLARARMTIRDNARALAAPAPAPVVEDAPSALEELGGGKGSLPRASRGPRR